MIFTADTEKKMMSDNLIRRSDAIHELMDIIPYKRYHNGKYLSLLNRKECLAAIKTVPTIDEPQEKWIPCNERLPEHSYTKRFWLTVKLDDGTITTLIGTWSAWGGLNGSKSYDAFDCWKDVMINGGVYRLSQPISKEQVLAWMPAPEPWKGAEENR